MMDSSTLGLRAADFSWTSIPTDLLLAELAKRDDAQTRPECGSRQRGAYDTAIHVFALILILVISTLACAFPLFGSRGKGKRQGTIVFLCQHFGTGVLMATAFVHLLPTAFTSLTDPCLPYAFSVGYKPMAGLIAMVSALVVVAIESYLTTRGAGHSHTHHAWEEDDEDEDGAMNGKFHEHGSGLSARRGEGHRPNNIALEDMGASEGLMAGVSPLPESTPTTQPPNGRSGFQKVPNEEEDDDLRESMDLELNIDELRPDAYEQPLTNRGASSRQAPDVPNMQHPSDADEQKRLLLQCLLLEAGILFHSVFIGMALSVATGPTFAVFLIAIAFHQSFEGLALGSRIAAIHFPRGSPRPWLMVLAYGTTTPIGQAIGLIVHNMYDPMSQTGLLMVGFMNAISSGLLLFAGMVQLLAEDFLTEKSYKTLHGRRRIQAYLAVLGGAGLMAAVGAFA